MRISTAHAYDATVERLSQRQSELSDAQLRLTSGKRVARASDDPISAARAERALASVARAGADRRSVDASRAAMTQIEGALGDAGDLLQTAREAIVGGGNASYDDSQRKILADQIRGLRNQLLAVANRADGAGSFLFGGQGSSTPPFLDAAGGVRYVGSRGEASANRSAGLPMTMDGAAAWMSAPTGNGVFETSSVTSSGSGWIDAGRVTDPAAITGSTYQLQFSVAAGVTTYSVLKDGAPTALTDAAFTAGQAIEFDGMAVTVSGAPASGDAFGIAPSRPELSVFDVLDKAAADLATPSLGSGAKAQATAANLSNIDAVLARMSSARASAGEALNRIDSTTGLLDTAVLNGNAERSAAEDLDMASAISDFQNRQTGYDVALKTYASVQRLSLFDYINP
jgi:flagellar hook-associated protein 3 FlgL